MQDGAGEDDVPLPTIGSIHESDPLNGESIENAKDLFEEEDRSLHLK